jgi:hypothetical protein
VPETSGLGNRPGQSTDVNREPRPSRACGAHWRTSGERHGCLEASPRLLRHGAAPVATHPASAVNNLVEHLPGTEGGRSGTGRLGKRTDGRSRAIDQAARGIRSTARA